MRLRIAEPDCIAEDFGGEIVALNMKTGYYFSLRYLASGIWLDLAAGHPSDDIFAAIGGTDTELGRIAVSLIDDIVERGLMVADERVETPPAGPLQVQLMLDAGVSDVAFEVYDDMQDLVLSDPIHDVDEETGWPVRRAEA